MLVLWITAKGRAVRPAHHSASRVMPYVGVVDYGRRPGRSPSPGHRPGEREDLPFSLRPNGPTILLEANRWPVGPTTLQDTKRYFAVLLLRAMPWAGRTLAPSGRTKNRRFQRENAEVILLAIPGEFRRQSPKRAILRREPLIVLYGSSSNGFSANQGKSEKSSISESSIKSPRSALGLRS